MIKEVDEAILESLRKGLSNIVPSENIVVEEVNPEKGKSIFLVNTGFTVDEQGVGGSGGVRREEVVEKFDSDSEKKNFSISQRPIKPLISVESPIGILKSEPDDYTVDYQNGVVSFRVPPEKGKENIRIKYNIARVVAETRDLKFTLTYSIYVRGENIRNRDLIMIEIIKTLYLEKTALAKKGVEEIQLIRGYTTPRTEGQNINEGIIEYQVKTTIKIEMLLPSIERIEIGKMK
jgi:hypothetical protein